MTLPKTPSFRLDGKRALVTGGSRGIGLGGAVALAEAGAHVVITARSTDEVNASAHEMREAGYSVDGVVLDVTDLDAVNAFINDQAPFDILFNNAGTNKPTPFVDVTPEQYDMISNVNSRAAFFVAQAVVKKLIAAGKGGSIIHTSSQMAHVGGLDRTVYCQTKFGVEGLNKAMALELAEHKIRVNTICPTFIRTPMTQSTFDDPDRVAWLTSKIKLGRVGEVEDIMGAVLYLASDMSALVTGSSLLVDGGWTAD
ncbi:MAG: SDR family oxidoreductase [Hyphomicrobiales bacterium]